MGKAHAKKVPIPASSTTVGNRSGPATRREEIARVPTDPLVLKLNKGSENNLLNDMTSAFVQDATAVFN
jgi:hypothetical protein